MPLSIWSDTLTISHFLSICHRPPALALFLTARYINTGCWQICRVTQTHHGLLITVTLLVLDPSLSLFPHTWRQTLAWAQVWIWGDSLRSLSDPELPPTFQMAIGVGSTPSAHMTLPVSFQPLLPLAKYKITNEEKDVLHTQKNSH